jgi:protein EFR3
MHLFTPNHVSLIAACYPSSSALASSGPEYRPNPQELSKLTYYAANRPGKINKLGGELEKRVKSACHKAQYHANFRARAYVFGLLKSLLEDLIFVEIGLYLLHFPFYALWR